MDLTPFFTTKSQAADFAARLAKISEALFTTEFRLEAFLLEEFGMKKKDAFLRLLQKNHISPEKPQDIKAFITTVQKEISALPLITVTIAFEPKEKTLTSLSDWFVMNLKQQYILAIEVDAALVGGAKIDYKGRSIDCTVKPVFDTVLQEYLKGKTQQTQHSVPQPAPQLTVQTT